MRMTAESLAMLGMLNADEYLALSEQEGQPAWLMELRRGNLALGRAQSSEIVSTPHNGE
jgi:hypothetical protein